MKKISLAFLALLLSAMSFAQDKQVDININEKSSGGFWGSPWMWIVGAAVFILLLVAITSRSRSTE